MDFSHSPIIWSRNAVLDHQSYALDNIYIRARRTADGKGEIKVGSHRDHLIPLLSKIIEICRAFFKNHNLIEIHDFPEMASFHFSLEKHAKIHNIELKKS
ncbi:MAG TPA: hypothetical protein P5048_02780 [Chlamydiales bacterium]|nr:hypothetical protein [Chlamydiales bacterium]